MGKKWFWVLLMTVLLGSGTQALAAYGQRKDVEKTVLLGPSAQAIPRRRKRFSMWKKKPASVSQGWSSAGHLPPA
jgi:hypothetical protein